MKALLPLIMLIGFLDCRIRLRNGGNKQFSPKLSMSVPRYLIPVKKNLTRHRKRENKEERPEVIDLDSHPSHERELFLMTDHKVNKERFNQRMGCKYIISVEI